MGKEDVVNKKDNLVVFLEEIRRLLKELVKNEEHLARSKPKPLKPRMSVQVASYKSQMGIFSHRVQRRVAS